MKEEPNTKFYFDGKIARVVFEDNKGKRIYWVDTTDLHPFHRNRLNLLYRIHERLHYPHHFLPIEEWLEEQGMTCVEDDMCLFAMRWL